MKQSIDFTFCSVPLRQLPDLLHLSSQTWQKHNRLKQQLDPCCSWPQPDLTEPEPEPEPQPGFRRIDPNFNSQHQEQDKRRRTVTSWGLLLQQNHLHVGLLDQHTALCVGRKHRVHNQLLLLFYEMYWNICTTSHHLNIQHICNQFWLTAGLETVLLRFVMVRYFNTSCNKKDI